MLAYLPQAAVPDTTPLRSSTTLHYLGRVAYAKPFYRNVRGVLPGPNAGYSGWAFIRDPDYALNPAHYTRALALILQDLREIFEYVEPSMEGESAFSYRIHALLMRTCIEIEANFKAIFAAHDFPPSPRERLDIRQYRRIDVTHHLSSYEVELPIWNGPLRTWRPFEPWHEFRGKAAPRSGVPLSWYQAYNASKHNRQQEFRESNLGVLIEAIAALLVVVSSQFKSETFDAGADHLELESGPYEPSIGGLFRIRYPDDWSDEEAYSFDWSKLKLQSDRFGRINYTAIPI